MRSRQFRGQPVVVKHSWIAEDASISLRRAVEVTNELERMGYLRVRRLGLGRPHAYEVVRPQGHLFDPDVRPGCGKNGGKTVLCGGAVASAPIPPAHAVHTPPGGGVQGLHTSSVTASVKPKTKTCGEVRRSSSEFFRTGENQKAKQFANVRRLIKGAMFLFNPQASYGDRAEALKQWAAENNLPYNGEAVTKAVEIAERRKSASLLG